MGAASDDGERDQRKTSEDQCEDDDGTGHPDRLSEPAAEDIRLERVMGVLSEPLRLTIVQRLLRGAEEFDQTCGWFGFDRPKSTLTHHFKALREAGVITQRQYGLERRSRVRLHDLNSRFPGLIDLVLNWNPASSAQ